MTIAHYIDYSSATGCGSFVDNECSTTPYHHSCHSSPTHQSHVSCLLCYSSDSPGPQRERDNYIIKHTYLLTYLLHGAESFLRS